TTIRAVFQKNYQIPLLTTWNLNIERQFLESWVARVGYQANKGTHLANATKPTRELNPAIYVPGASDTGNTQERRQYQDFSNIGLTESAHNSHYNALQLNLEKRFGKGLSILTNYTWAKGIDDYGWTNPFNRRFDYGPSDD